MHLNYIYIFFFMCQLFVHVRWVLCHHSKARPQVADGGDGLLI
jgi:hypothetical protein